MKQSVYTRPDKPTRLEVKKRFGAPARVLPKAPEVLAVDRASECHVTPESIAETMVDALEASRDQLTLEPQAGTGSLVQALLDDGHSPFEITMVERSIELCGAIRKRFSSTSLPDPIQQCFLDYAGEAENKIEFSRIIMNPPFRKTKPHIDAALSLLGNSGHTNSILVPLVQSTFEHEEAELIETLSDDVFGSTKVNSKIIKIVR